MRLRALSAILAPLFGLMLAACDGPCESLAERICSCEPNSTEERGCIEQVKTAMQVQPPPTMAETMACSDLLDTCDCDALQRDDLAACGLAK